MTEKRIIINFDISIVADRKKEIGLSMKVVIKNVCCKFCAAYVHNLLDDLGLPVAKFQFGEAFLEVPPTDQQLSALEVGLRAVGLELVYEQKNVLVEKMKSIMREMMNQTGPILKVNFSNYLSEKMQYNYSYLSNIFSEAEGITIREYGIALRIERVKQLLVQDQMDLLEIATRLQYSSVAHLSAQFKKVTGQTTSEYKRQHIGTGHFEKLAS
jgi:AraC-like DNA-binding protein